MNGVSTSPQFAGMPRTIPLAMATGAALPVGYLVTKHVQWQSSRADKQRMAVHQLSFWSALGLGIVMLHRFKRRWNDFSTLGQILRPLLITAPALAAFEWGDRLAGMFISPEPPEPSLPKPVFQRPEQYRPRYLQGQTTNGIQPSANLSNG